MAECRYDVLLGMPGHTGEQVTVHYGRREVTVGGYNIPVTDTGNEIPLQISNMGVKTCRKLVRKPGTGRDLEIIRVVQVNCNESSSLPMGSKCEGKEEMERIISKHIDVIKEELPDWLPPLRSVHHTIETDPDEKSPHRRLLTIFPAELRAARIYISKLLKRGKTNQRKSPHGAPLFLRRTRTSHYVE